MNANLFDSGCLVILSTSCWTGRVRIPSKVLLGDDHADINPGFVGAHKRLVDGSSLKLLEQIRAEARRWLYDHSLPFPLDGIVFIPAGEIETADKKMQEYAKHYSDAADTFASDFDTLREAAKHELGSLYSETDYPSDIRSKFAFTWRFVSMAPVGDSKVLSASVVAQERDKFQQLMKDAAEQAVIELRTRFAACVDHLVERLSGVNEKNGKPKFFRAATVENLKEFFNTFEALNVVGDGELQALVERAKEVITGVEAQKLRDDSTLRAHIASDMGVIQEQLDTMLVDRPTRKLRIVKTVVPEVVSPTDDETEVVAAAPESV